MMDFLSPKDLKGYVPDPDIPHLIRGLNHLIRRRVAEKLGLYCEHDPVKKQYPHKSSDYVCAICGDDLDLIAITKEPKPYVSPSLDP
jgi:hypothetical protein